MHLLSSIKKANRNFLHDHNTEDLNSAFITILDSIDADVYVADLESYIVLFVNQHMRNDFGEHLVGKLCYQVFRNTNEPCPHCTNNILLNKAGKPDGEYIWEAVNPITGRWYKNSDRAIKWIDGKYVRLQIATDITELKKGEKRLARMALSDPLTNMPNRIRFEKDLEIALQSARENHSRMAVLFLDLDKFKSVNDQFGHHIGDILLQKLTNRLQGCLRSSDIAARVSGDEFTFILKNIPNATIIYQISRRIIDAVSAPYKISGHKINISGSLGVSIFPEDGQDADQLMQKADKAMYFCKKRGGNHYIFFDQLPTEK